MTNSADATNLDSASIVSASGTITAIGSEVVEGTTMYYVRISGAKDKIFMFSSSLCTEIVFAKEGDKYSISYIPTEDTLVSAVEVEFISSSVTE